MALAPLSSSLAWREFTSHPAREEIAARGDEIFEREFLPRLGPEDQGKFVLIAVRTADYEADLEELAASDRLLARRSDAEVWLRQPTAGESGANGV